MVSNCNYICVVKINGLERGLREVNIGVALTVLNGEDWLVEQIESILSQANIAVTIYISMEPSHDNSESIVRRYVRDKTNVVFLPVIQSSGSAAMNFFRIIKEVDLSKHEYFAFGDQDDIWMFSKLERAVNEIEKNEAVAYSSNLFAFSEKKTFLVKKSDPQKELDYLFQGASAGCTYVLQAKAMQFVKDKILSNYDSLPERPSHDWLIYAICRSHGLSWCFDDQSHIFYRQHDANVRGANISIADYFTRLKVSRNGWYRNHVVGLECFIKGSKQESDVIAMLKRYGIIDRLRLSSMTLKFRRNVRESYLLKIVILLGLM